MNILLTGAAGFIGAALAKKLLERGNVITGVDNLNNYYDVKLKQNRLALLEPFENFHFLKADIADREQMSRLFKKTQPQRVIHMAAQAGVRYSITHPHAYISANIQGFMNILEECRHHHIEHLVYASSSSVYGANTRMPFSVYNNVDHPISLYAATKKSNELMAHTYSYLYRIPTTGLRFFTVYGPWGRPDMALFLFTKNILAGKPIDLFNNGKHTRDFTYIDDITEGIISAVHNEPLANDEWESDEPMPNTSNAPYRLYNIGSNNPMMLTRFIEIIEECLGMKAKRNLLPLQPGDVPDTYADIETFVKAFNYFPQTTPEKGIQSFITWYRDYHQV